MELRYNVTGEARKALVKAVSEITGEAPVYQGAPSFAFAVGGIMVSRHGALSFGEGAGMEEMGRMVAALAERGFVSEDSLEVPLHDAAPAGEADTAGAADDPAADADVIPAGEEPGEDDGDVTDAAPADAEPCEAMASDDPGKLAINFPLSGFTASAMDNLERLIAAKAWILKKMAGADELPIERDEKYLIFPWFKPDASPAEVDAYSRLIAGLCETAKDKKRVTARERQLEDGDNEKFKARCMLLALGFIGKEYAQARKILLEPMSGGGSFKSGSSKKESMVVAGAGGGAVLNPAGAVTPLRCGECLHHCYHTEGPMRTSTGELVYPSKRMPDRYTHYCLGTSRGFRKLKSASDWTGLETPPKWCPLSNQQVTSPGSALACASALSDPDADNVDMKEIMRKCVGGLIIYAAQRLQIDPDFPRLPEIRGHIGSIASYWVLDDLSDEILRQKFLMPFDALTEFVKGGAEIAQTLEQHFNAIMIGLYCHCKDLESTHGSDAKAEILSVAELAKEISLVWEFEMHGLEVSLDEWLEEGAALLAEQSDADADN